MKVIFLDIEGVLIAYDTHFMKSRTLDPSKVAMLKEIVDRTGAVIVISSTWRDLLTEAAEALDNV